MKIIDLTHALSSEIPTWDGSCGFELTQTGDYETLFRTHKINCGAGIGTHMDAPAHVVKGGVTIDKLLLENLVTDCAVIKVKGAENTIIGTDVIEEFEKANGKIKPNTFVIFHTGWDKFWDEKEKYINNHKFPSVAEDTAKLLIERGVSGIGIDTLSADTGANGFPVHMAVLGAGKYLVENISNAGELPPTGARVMVMPIKIEDGTEAPIRLVAIIE